MNEPIAIAIAALIGLVGVLVGSTLTFRQKTDELFLAGLQYFTGGSQKRNAGIAALQLAWDSKRHRKVIVPMLAGAAVYLLAESKQKDAAHELHNLGRIMDLLAMAHRERVLSHRDRSLVVGALLSRRRGEPGQESGLWVSQGQIDGWLASLERQAA